MTPDGKSLHEADYYLVKKVKMWIKIPSKSQESRGIGMESTRLLNLFAMRRRTLAVKELVFKLSSF